jgi:hypothetical protein
VASLVFNRLLSVTHAPCHTAFPSRPALPPHPRASCAQSEHNQGTLGLEKYSSKVSPGYRLKEKPPKLRSSDPREAGLHIGASHNSNDRAPICPRTARHRLRNRKTGSGRVEMDSSTGVSMGWEASNLFRTASGRGEAQRAPKWVGPVGLAS